MILGSEVGGRGSARGFWVGENNRGGGESFGRNKCAPLGDSDSLRVGGNVRHRDS